MPQTSQTVVINATPDQLWVLLNDMIAHPERYEPGVVLKKFDRGETTSQRLVTRDGLRVEEILEINRDALMIELTVPSTTENQNLSLIHQIVPSGTRTILNLAATWTPSEAAPLEDGSWTVNTMNARLAGLGERIKGLAEELAR